MAARGISANDFDNKIQILYGKYGVNSKTETIYYRLRTGTWLDAAVNEAPGLRPCDNPNCSVCKNYASLMSREYSDTPSVPGGYQNMNNISPTSTLIIPTKIMELNKLREIARLCVGEINTEHVAASGGDKYTYFASGKPASRFALDYNITTIDMITGARGCMKQSTPLGTFPL